jgi:hypothetical protein
MSLLFGIALDGKLIPGIDKPVFNYFPEYADLHTPGKARISLRHLLMMSSRLEWNEYLRSITVKPANAASCGAVFEAEPGSQVGVCRHLPVTKAGPQLAILHPGSSAFAAGQIKRQVTPDSE